MNSLQEGEAYIADARIILTEAEDSFARGHFHRAVRKCQESVELALKGLLRLYGVEYPRRHVFASVLRASPVARRTDPGELDTIIEIADRLAEEREASFYGMGPTPARQLFSASDARDSIAEVKQVMDFVDRLRPTPLQGA